MRTRLQLLAGVVLVSAVGLWALLGAHAGWTRTSVEVRTLDEVTGLEGIRYESRFVPGLDFLAAAALGAALLAGVSCLVRPKPDPTQIRP